MNKLKIVVAILFAPALMFAQGSFDALKLSKTEIKGSARSMGMAGAFNALGGEAYSLSNNPGGLGVFSRSELSTTMNLTSASTKLDQGDGFVIDQSKTNFVFDNLTYIINLSDFDADGFNIGIGYNRLASFSKQYRGGNNNFQGGLPGYMAHITNNTPIQHLNTDLEKQYQNSELSWMSILGYDSFLFDVISGSTNQYAPFSTKQSQNHLQISELGRVDEYAFSLGGNVEDILYWGATLGVTDLSYSMRTNYSENYYEDGNFDLYNDLVTKGTGLTGKFGVIVRPLDFLRLGFSFHTPTFYTMTDYYYGETAFSEITASNESGFSSTPSGESAYQLRTPLKFMSGLAFVLGKNAIISADYEYQDFRKARLRSIDGYAFKDNEYIKSDYQSMHTFKVGAEIRPTSQLSLRVGYAMQTSPVKQSVRDGNIEIVTVGTMSHYYFDKGTQLITGGIGYRWSNFYIDAAVVSRTNKQDIWAYSPYFTENGVGAHGDNNKVSINNNRIETLLSVGYKF